MVNVSNLAPDGTAVVNVGGIPGAVPVYFRAAARARVSYGSELLAPLDEHGPLTTARYALETVYPRLSGVSIAGYGLVMSAAGGQPVLLSGTALGIDVADITVSYTNGKASHLAVDCSVLTPNQVLSCKTAAGVGAGFVWSVTVDGTANAAPAPLASKYNGPTILGAELVVSNGVGGENGHPFYQLTGRDFGPIGTPIDRAFLYSPIDSRVVFYAQQCNVTVADTVMLCAVPEGAGNNLLWTVVIGGQASAAPTVAYAPPAIISVSCLPSPCDALATTGGDTVVLRGAHFGPPSGEPNFVDGVYGGVQLVGTAGTADSISLLGCRVTVLQTEVSCTTPGGFGIGLALTIAVLRQPSPPSHVRVSFSLPTVTHVGAGILGASPLLVNGNTVIVFGHSLGAPGVLILNGVLVASAGPETGHTRLVFRVGVLPLPLVGLANVSVRVILAGITSNAVTLAASPPAVADLFALAIADTAPAGGCAGTRAALYWVTVSGSNFGLNSSTTTLATTGMPGTSAVCSISDTPDGRSLLLFATNATTGTLSVILGALNSRSVSFNANLLLLQPTVAVLQNASSPLAASQLLGFVSTAGGDLVRLVGANFHASDRVFIAPSGLRDASLLTAESRLSLSECTIASIAPTSIVCVMPPGVGRDRSVALFARGAFIANTPSVSYAAPTVSGISVRQLGAVMLGNGGGDVFVTGTSFGVWNASVSIFVNSLECVLEGEVHDTSLVCRAPACDARAPTVVVTVGGQSVSVSGLLTYAAPRVDSISPRRSRTAGGGTMLLRGDNFGVPRPTVVFVLPQPLVSVTALVLQWTQTEVEVRVPAGASGASSGNGSLVSVELRTSLQVGRIAQCFEYDGPVFERASPPTSSECSVEGCVLTITGDNFGSAGVLRAAPPVVRVNSLPCFVQSYTDTTIACAAPPGSGTANSVVVTVFDRNATSNGTAFSYGRPVILYAVPRVVDQHEPSDVVLVGSNFVRKGLQISISGVWCAAPVFLNGSAVACSAARFLSVGLASVTVRVDGQDSLPAGVVAECRKGFYGSPGDGACMPCPVDALCIGHGADPVALAGFWQLGRTRFVACVPPIACPARTPGENGTSCSAGYTGVECRKCASLYYRLATDCVPCPNNAWVLVLLFVAAVVCCGALAAWMHRRMFNIKGLTIGVDMMQVPRARCRGVVGDLIDSHVRRRCPCSQRSSLRGRRSSVTFLLSRTWQHSVQR